MDFVEALGVRQKGLVRPDIVIQGLGVASAKIEKLVTVRSFVWVSLCGVDSPLAHMSRVQDMRGSWNLSTPSHLI